MVSIPVIAHFAAAAFFGNTAFCAMGFGMGICFLFVYQIGAIAGLTDCCGLPGLKYAVFIQTIAALVVQPIVLWKVGLKKNLRFEMMLTFIPMQFIGTPLGQFLQDYTPSEILKIIVGVVTLGVAFWQIFNIWQVLRQPKQPVDYEMVGDGGVDYYDIEEDDEEEENTNKPSAFFLIGSDGSGSEKLGDLIRARNLGIAVPPTMHIDANIIPSFGDLSQDQNFRNLVHATCEYVEKNPAPWTDKHKAPIAFNRKQVAQRSRKTRTLIGVLEAVMDTYAESNDCKTWICTSNLAAEHNSDLSDHYGNRLQYIYLYRDPRDVCVSLKATSSTDSHLYVVAETWARQQGVAMDLARNKEDGVYQVNYEALVQDEDRQLELMEAFLTGKTAGDSELLKNMTRESSFEDKELTKWGKDGNVTEEELQLIENVCSAVMLEQGYKVKSEKPADYSVDQVKAFVKENAAGLEEKKKELKKMDPESWGKREDQREVIVRFTRDTVALPLTLPDNEDEDDKKLVVKEKKEKKSTSKSCGQFMSKIKNELWPVRSVIVWMCIAGFMSGFLGGLIGVRGPPLIIFFFFFEYPKVQVKANGSLVAWFNTIVRIITYFAKPPTDEYTTLYGHETWFVKEDLYLYLSVAAASLLACPLGLYLTRYLNKWGYKACLTLLLIVNGITMIATATMDML